MFRRGGHGTRTTGRLDGKEAAVAVQAALAVVGVRVGRRRDSVGQNAVADDGSVGVDETEAAVDTADATDACVSNGHGRRRGWDLTRQQIRRPGILGVRGRWDAVAVVASVVVVVVLLLLKLLLSLEEEVWVDLDRDVLRVCGSVQGYQGRGRGRGWYGRWRCRS